MTARPERILYLEDEDEIAEVTAMALELLGGYEVRRCADGRAALGAAAEGFAPDLCLFDVMLPDADGVSVWAQLRDRMRPPPPVVFLTARAQTHEQAEYLRAGAMGVISKPYEPRDLIARLARLRALAAEGPEAGEEAGSQGAP